MPERVQARHLVPLLAIILATFLIVGACGGDDDASPTPGDETAQPTASPGDTTEALVSFPASIDACDLIRADEVVRFLGGDPSPAAGVSDDVLATCIWPGGFDDETGTVSVVNLAITTSRTGFDVHKVQLGYQPLEDLGDEAYVQGVGVTEFSLLNNGNNIIVRDGIYFILFSVGGPLERNEARDEMLAILPRILEDLP